MKLSRKSWHFHIANVGSRIGSRTNLCDYVKSFCAGIFALFIVTVVIGCIMLPWIDLMAYVVAGVQCGFYDYPFMIAGVVVELAFLVLVLGFYLIIDYFDNNDNPRFVTVVYKSWKDKFCPTINITE